MFMCQQEMSYGKGKLQDIAAYVYVMLSIAWLDMMQMTDIKIHKQLKCITTTTYNLNDYLEK